MSKINFDNQTVISQNVQIRQTEIIKEETLFKKDVIDIKKAFVPQKQNFLDNIHVLTLQEFNSIPKRTNVIDLPVYGSIGCIFHYDSDDRGTKFISQIVGSKFIIRSFTFDSLSEGSPLDKTKKRLNHLIELENNKFKINEKNINIIKLENKKPINEANFKPIDQLNSLPSKVIYTPYRFAENPNLDKYYSNDIVYEIQIQCNSEQEALNMGEFFQHSIQKDVSNIKMHAVYDDDNQEIIFSKSESKKLEPTDLTAIMYLEQAEKSYLFSSKLVDNLMAKSINKIML